MSPRAAIARYVEKAFAALVFRSGFAHTELFMTAGGPVFIQLIIPRIGDLRGYIGCGRERGSSRPYRNRYTNVNAHHAWRMTQPMKNSGDRRRHSRALTLFNFTGTALPDLAARLSGFASVRQVLQLAPVGSECAGSPWSASDIAASVFCTHADAAVLALKTRSVVEGCRRLLRVMASGRHLHSHGGNQ